MTEKSERAVYEEAAGITWSVTPPTEAHAREEAELAGASHHASVEVTQAEEPAEHRIARAFANGWREGFERGARADRLDRW